MNLADTFGVHKYHHFGVKIIEIGTSFLKLSGKIGSFMGPAKDVRNAKNMPCS